MLHKLEQHQSFRFSVTRVQLYPITTKAHNVISQLNQCQVGKRALVFFYLDSRIITVLLDDAFLTKQIWLKNAKPFLELTKQSFTLKLLYFMFFLQFFLLQVFLEPLKEIQQMGHLQHVDVNKIFCNVQDLCEVI